MDTLRASVALVIAFGFLWVPKWFAAHYVKSQRYRMTYTEADRWPDRTDDVDLALLEERRRAAQAEQDAIYQSGHTMGIFLMFGAIGVTGWLAHAYLP